MCDECWGVKQSKYFWQFWRERSPGHEHLCTCCSNLRSCSAHCRQRPLQSLLLINTLCTGYWLHLESGPHHWDISRSILSMFLLRAVSVSGSALHSMFWMFVFGKHSRGVSMNICFFFLVIFPPQFKHFWKNSKMISNCQSYCAFVSSILTIFLRSSCICLQMIAELLERTMTMIL